MPTLASELRNKLERVVIDARDAAETGARAGLEALAVQHHEPFPHMNPAQRELRNHLRARARQLGDRQEKSGRLAIDHLVGECAYEHWHRMLFARFLAENGLLIEPKENMAISLAEAEELAKEDGVNVWIFASCCAQGMLPQIFRPDDPLLQVSFATEHMLKLENLLASLPQAVFNASDALGWVYQFWQSKKKDDVNRSAVKIGADEISAVTQLFTEPYMVEFLLHNTLGAWWSGKKLTAQDAANAKTEDELRRKLVLPGVGWDYIRFVRAFPSPAKGEGRDELGGPWHPAAGTFDDWPKTAAELKVLDPSCGSGHFLVAALHHIVPIRMAEEDLSVPEAVDAVLWDNLYGLEIDERCCQITAFALAFAAWTYPNAGGYRPLPDLHIACTGLSVGGTREQWLRILEGQGNLELRFFFGQLYDLFRKAPTLGSLINPHRFIGSGMLDRKGMETLLRHLKTAIADDPNAAPEKQEMGIAAQGLAKAAELLADRYTLVITNVPYLGRGKQDDILKEHLAMQYPLGKADLATAFVLRCLEFCANGSSTALVTPQNWLFLTSYTKLRETLLAHREWNFVARLGPGAFETITGHVVNVTLFALSATTPADDHVMSGIDVSAAKQPDEKAALLRGYLPADIALVPQAEQLKNPDAVVQLERHKDVTRLSDYVDVLQGVSTGDGLRFVRRFWEAEVVDENWELFHESSNRNGIAGLTGILFWQQGRGELSKIGTAQKGIKAQGKSGIGVGVTGQLPRMWFLGTRFDGTVAVILPKSEKLLSPVAAFVFSEKFPTNVRRVDQALSVTEASFGKVPFDLTLWQKVAAEKYPNGMPEPESDDPTQWLFHGYPGGNVEAASTRLNQDTRQDDAFTLQVAVARLLGYRWPAELDDKMRLSKRARATVKQCDELGNFADDDGIVCIPSVRGEEPAAERLLALLAAAGIKPTKVRELAGGVDLDDWLRNSFFEEHCKLFHDRPFVWHIWDGRKRDGFHVLVNYHKLCEGGGKGRRLLESLTYAYLGEWITRQKDGVKRGEGGAEDRLAAALELQKRIEATIEGEPPFDLFVRWKPLAEQPIGWEPDINDGVRLNIRPFMALDLPGGKTGVGVLRSKPNIKWGKDRGKEPKRSIREYPWFWSWDSSVNYAGGPLSEFTGERFNDCHYTTEFKRQARQQAGGKQ